MLSKLKSVTVTVTLWACALPLLLVRTYRVCIICTSPGAQFRMPSYLIHTGGLLSVFFPNDPPLRHAPTHDNRTYDVVIEATYANNMTVQSDIVQFSTARADTFWLSVSRVSENFLDTIDFLADHDSGDIQGVAAFMASSGTDSHVFFDHDKSPLTGYCVEIEKVDLSSLKRTPTTPPSIKPAPRFADYVSCNGQKEKDYKCICAYGIDRFMGRQTMEQIKDFCPDAAKFPGNCRCTPESTAASAKYVGWLPIPMPYLRAWDIPHYGNKSAPWPPVEPPAITPFGNWYSHPAKTKCKDTVGRIGDGTGCTWRRDPRATLLYSKTLVEHKWSWVKMAEVTESLIKANVEAAKNARAAIPLKSRCCGC
eukprot:m.111641 g.111641  ORF g.111641 m.111641 type:complete len:366 (-) comp10756_c1_seq4:85-1182(-)